VKTEVFGARLSRREAAALFSPSSPAAAMKALEETLVYRDLAGQLRGSTRAVEDATWERLLEFLCAAAWALSPVSVAGAPALEELEFNPARTAGAHRLSGDGAGPAVDAPLRGEQQRAEESSLTTQEASERAGSSRVARASSMMLISSSAMTSRLEGDGPRRRSPERDGPVGTPGGRQRGSGEDVPFVVTRSNSTYACQLARRGRRR
jgi:hypothetical protein